MAKISELILGAGKLSDVIDQATLWAQKGLDVVIATRQTSKTTDVCEFAYISMLFNVALMRRVSCFAFFSNLSINCFSFSYRGKTPKLVSCTKLLQSNPVLLDVNQSLSMLDKRCGR
jgi:hypothetical protein